MDTQAEIDAYVTEFAEKYGVDRRQAERMVLGYEPIPGSMAHARAQLGKALARLRAALVEAFLSDFARIRGGTKQ